MTVRAFRNANPGNIEAGATWQGLLPRSQMTPEQAAEPRFAVFQSPKWGFRALAITLLNYHRDDGLNTIRQFISRWAPSSENNTAAYISAVCNEVSLGPDTPMDFTKPDLLAALCKAIAVHEAGSWLFSDADLNAGILMADPVRFNS